MASRRTNKEKAELQISQLEATMRVGERGWEVQSAEIPRRVPTRCSKKKAGSFAERVVHFSPGLRKLVWPIARCHQDQVEGVPRERCT